MPVPSSIGDLSTTPGSNFPAGSESPTTFDDYMRTFAAFIAQLRDGKAASVDAVLLTGDQTIAGTKTFSSAIVGNATNVTGVVAIANGGTGATTAAAARTALGIATEDVGSVKAFARSTAPSGWVKANGGTIGNASSGGTTRANADTEALFTLLWGEFSQSILPIQTSAGGASTRGASAAADYAANKRLPLLDLRGEFVRGLDDSRGVDATRVNGTGQLDAFQGHYHDVTLLAGTGSSNGFGGTTGNATATVTPPPYGATTPRTDGTNGTPRIAAETRPRNVALLYCIKL